MAASVLEAVDRPSGTDLNPDDPEDVRRAMETVLEVGTDDRPIDGLYGLAIAAVSESRSVRIAARQRIQQLSTAKGDHLVRIRGEDNQRFVGDISADDIVVRAGVVCAVRWLAPYASGHLFPRDVLDELIPAIVDALSDEHRTVRRGAALSIVECRDNDGVLTLLDSDLTEYLEEFAATARDDDPFVRGHALAALRAPESSDDPDGFRTAIDAYRDGLSDDRVGIQRTALDGLRQALSEVRPATEPPEEIVALAPGIARGLNESLGSSSPVVRRRASELLWRNSSLFTSPSDNGEEIVTELKAIGETATQLSPDTEIDRNLVNAFSRLLEQYPQLAEPAASVATRTASNRVFAGDSFGKESALDLIEESLDAAPETDLPMDGLYAALADPAETVRVRAATVLAENVDRAPDSTAVQTVGDILSAHWEAESDDAAADPLVTVAQNDPERAAALGRRLVARTPDSDVEGAVELLRAMSEGAPETLEPVLEETRNDLE
ncbi:hypothetical protein HARCEL1_12505 [Halococcoides cellulosivorans]|uniref:HEAT repeat domain-containing protein n=1 Tax=Halococcoides cellulosivorans TaxID=1679096 RepID=A0A2R4X430_9EURY|nr:hypothetical protein HARCEL1_12505 [Halococcoides cellulosivorans]